MNRPGLRYPAYPPNYRITLLEATSPDLESENEIGCKQQLIFIGAAVKGL
jgi:hypothetical protein